MRLAASVLAHQSQAASLVTAPHPEQARFKHLELIGTHGRQVLMVLVLVGRRSPPADAHPGRAGLAGAAQPRPPTRSTTCARGWTPMASLPLPHTLDALEQDVLKLVADEMRRSADVLAGEVYRDGLTNVLAEPEFAEVRSRPARRCASWKSARCWKTCSPAPC